MTSLTVACFCMCMLVGSSEKKSFSFALHNYTFTWPIDTNCNSSGKFLSPWSNLGKLLLNFFHVGPVRFHHFKFSWKISTVFICEFYAVFLNVDYFVSN